MEKPPVIKSSSYVQDTGYAQATNVGTKAHQYVREVNEAYWYWSDFKYRKLPERTSLSHEEWWALVQQERESAAYHLDFHNVLGQCYYNIPQELLKRMHEFDMQFGGQILAEAIAPDSDKEAYLLNSVMEEAIASSQIEGAATTRAVARKMILEERAPRDTSEQMIFNNFNTIRFLLSKTKEPLTKELVLDIHRHITEKTLAPEKQGYFRTNDEVRVVDAITGDIVHYPPSHELLDELIERYCQLANEEFPEGFMHPLIRACILHFLMGYIHPFADGNGRTARAIFYWYLLSKGYWLTQYVSISRVIVGSKAQYSKAYLQTEYTGNDLTYFILYNCKVLFQAYGNLNTYLEKKRKEQAAILKFRGMPQLNERQKMLLQRISENKQQYITAKEMMKRYATSDETARADLKELANMKLLEQVKEGKQWVFYPSENFKQRLKELMG